VCNDLITELLIIETHYISAHSQYVTYLSTPTAAALRYLQTAHAQMMHLKTMLKAHLNTIYMNTSLLVVCVSDIIQIIDCMI